MLAIGGGGGGPSSSDCCFMDLNELSGSYVTRRLSAVVGTYDAIHNGGTA